MPNEQMRKSGPETPDAAEEATRETPECAAPEAPPADDVEQLRIRIEILERQAEEAKERSLRAQAELENLRKRTTRDIESAHKYALERFVGDLLPVIDSLELGVGAAASAGDSDSLRQGMDLTLKMFLDSLARFGVTPIDPAGEKFNPDRHQAVSVEEAEGREAGTIVSVVQKGYELNGRLVRPAMVVVAK
ncbi:MAG TPA: nucleotide exchange factor GrpE [Hyphomonadaceae bacterium]|jgi:molecular chaperone GrpE